MPAQTSAVAHLAVQSGNGQVACICITATLQSFAPIIVKATDVHGNPVAGATVTWAITNTNGSPTLGSTTTTTASDGTSSNTINQVILNNYSTSAVPYLTANIQATANGNSVVFTETQSLVDQSTPFSEIQANPPTFNGANVNQASLSGNVGSTLSTPIQINVGGLGTASNGVPNVAIRLLNGQTSPTISCASQGGYADPGTVLTDSHGNASCYPTFSGSGTGTFYVMVGGEPGSTLAGAQYLEIFPDLATEGGFTFSSIAGAPSTLQIVSGNNQVGNVGQVLNPLVVRLTDSGGNAVQGQTIVWSVVPAGSLGLSLSTNCTSGSNGTVDCVTDNNGQSSLTGNLDSLAAAGAQVTATLQSNSSISVTFQLTLSSSISSMTKISGDNQSTQANSNFPLPLVVQVNNSTGPVANYPVQFQTNGPVSLVNTQNGILGTGSNGQASLIVKAGSLAGTATVTAVVGILTQTFNLTITSTPSGPTPNGISIVSGNNQSAVESATFGSPLIVQVNSTSGPVSGIPVSFSTSGPISLSNGSLTTGSNGQAQLTVTAGATSGQASVTASIAGGYSATFNLTVSPPGPNLNSSSFLNAASRQVGAISPCALAIISAAGLTPDGMSDFVPAPVFGHWPVTTPNNLSVTFGTTAAPIRNVYMGPTNPEVMVQVPCEVTPASSVPVTVKVGAGSATTSIAVQTVSPGIFQNVMSDGVSRAVVVRDDGSFADVGTVFPNPARRGEKIRLYVTGLGATIPPIGTNSIQDPNADLVGAYATVAGTVQVGIVGFGGLQVVSSRQAPDLIGVFEVQVVLPTNAPTGNSVQITVGIVPAGASATTPGVSSLPALIPIQ